VLVTWRLVEDVPSLRQARYADIIFAGIAGVHTSAFRITDLSIQTNHMHLLSEADDSDALADGIMRLSGRISRRLNRAMGRHGDLFNDRYHERALATPREVRNALRYVINNARHHDEAIHLYHHPDWIDPYSSGRWFDGWRRPLTHDQPESFDPYVRRVTAEPHTWLRRIGWQRWGLIDFDEIPGGDPT
jgi:REP element-mobilizing transposase RayT